MRRIHRQSLLLAISLVMTLSQVATGQGSRYEDVPSVRQPVDLTRTWAYPRGVGSSERVDETPVGGTPFDTIGFGWTAGGFYYTVFSNPRVLPVTAMIPPATDFLAAGEFVDGTVYMIDVFHTLYEVEAASGQILSTVVATAPPNSQFYSGMAIDPTTGIMYACSTDFDSASSLLTIDLATGVASLIGPVTNEPVLQGIAIDGAGELWGFGTTNDSLLSINKTTAAGVIVGPLGIDARNIGGAGGMAWDPIHDVLWASAFTFTSGGRDELLAVDRATGSTDFSFELGKDFPGIGGLGWLGLATPEYFQLFSDGFESGDTSAWSNTVP